MDFIGDDGTTLAYGGAFDIGTLTLAAAAQDRNVTIRVRTYNYQCAKGYVRRLSPFKQKENSFVGRLLMGFFFAHGHSRLQSV